MAKVMAASQPSTTQHWRKNMEPDQSERIGNALPPKVTARQERVITELLTQATTRKAAKSAGVSEQTVRRWRACDANFIARYNEARREVFESGMKFCNAVSGGSAQVLWNIAKDEQSPPAARVSAARAILHFNMLGWEKLEVVQRLEKLEQNQVQLRKELPPIEEDYR
jgi:hypothetical protein